ncbi:uncharacterized protein APUU_11077A [Aspergillus puulaauensis]|uniref:ZZ-type domain-containing protein n=1 Tax=Aspergillus puulaauensis TaxID=1220207 RepID=A0A7R8AG52_9EURO|nr:uncharacterized protein APUU_11077A [Aspergillus puulaauensis]BCS18249.1 hypothetical protein APUU_11077A [Aspergillus puulaauensis]
MSELEQPAAPIDEDKLPIQTEYHAQPVRDVPESDPKLDIRDDETSGLITLQRGTSNTYVVLVQGIANLEWKSQKRWETWMPWLDGMGLKDDHTVKAYHYDIASQDPAIFSITGIEKEAGKLLEGLTSNEEQEPTRRYIFVALDIGGILIKKTLISASLEPTKYGDLDYRTSGLVFVSCPHRTSTIEEAEDYIGTLVSLNSHFPSNSMRKIRELAQAVQAINRDFLETKYLIRAVICNIVSPRIRNIVTEDKTDNKSEADSDSDSDSDEESTVEEQSVPDATPEDTPASLLGSSCSWFAIPFELVLPTQISYLEVTTASIRSDAEILSPEHSGRLKLALDAARNAEMDMAMHCVALSRAPPLYPPERLLCETPLGDCPEALLTSDPYRQWLDQRGTCVLHLHGTSDVSAMTQQLAGRLNSWKNGEDSAVFFEFSRRDIRFRSIKACLSSMLAILCSRFCHLYPKYICDLIEGAYCKHDAILDNLYAALMSIRIQDNGRGLTFIVNRLEECDESREWLVKRLSMQRNHHHRYRFAWIISSQGSDAIKSDLSGWPAIDIDGHSLTRDMHLQDQLPLPPYLACRFWPFSEGELAILASLQSEAVHDSVADTADGKSHAVMARSCLRYLRDPAVQAQMQALCNNAALTRPPLYTDHQKLISYATSYWPLHYQLSGDDRPFQSAVDFFADPPSRNTWSNAQYLLCNPGSWLERCYLSPLPLMAMHGLDDLVSEWLGREEDCKLLQLDGALAVREAVRRGHVSTARLLLAAVDLNEFALADALTAAASFGEGGMIHELAEKASTIDGFQWPRLLLMRLAFLGLHSTARLLLDSGEQVDPPDQAHGSASLHSAAFWAHEMTLQVLLAAKPDLNYSNENGVTALHFAALLGSADSIRLLLEAGAAIEAQTDYSMTPLQVALHAGNIGAFEILLEAGADPNQGKHGRWDVKEEMKPLFYCAYNGLVEETKLLLAYKADINVKYWDGKLSAAYFAVDRGHVEVAELLLQSGADANENPPRWDLILLAAASDSDETRSLAMVRLLLDHGARIEDEDNSSSWRSTALSRASGTENTEVVKLLLDEGADVNHRGKGSDTPLYSACYTCQLANVRLLITSGANVNEEPEDPDEWSPIHACYDSAEIVKTLLDNGADPSRLAGRESCLHLAVRNHQADTVRVLLAHRPKIDLELTVESPAYDEDDNYTALCVACHSVKSAKIVRKLLDAGANANHQTKLGKRPLDICVQAGSTAVARALLEYRVPVDSVDNDGNTPLHHVSSSTERGLIELLVRAGLDPWELNDKGITPFRRAVEVGNYAVVKYLLSRDSIHNRFLDGSPSLVRSACQNGDLQTLKALVSAGADLRSIDSMPGATGLLVTAIDKWKRPNQELVEYLVTTGGVNINGPGLFGYPLIAACVRSHEEQVQYLLNHGADVNLQDSTGRTALHVASVRGVLTVVEALLSAAGEHSTASATPKDRMGRTAVHFAAASGNWDVFQRVSSLYDAKELTEPDYDGWTPLFWALRNQKSSADIVQHLIEHGADPWARDQDGNGSWSPVKLAKYIGAPEDVQVALRDSSPRRDKNSSEEFSHDSQPAQYQSGWVCDSCRLGIFGIRYACQTCEGYDLCFRCYMSRERFHSDHAQDRWVEKGSEFEDDTPSSDKGDDESIASSNELSLVSSGSEMDSSDTGSS